MTNNGTFRKYLCRLLRVDDLDCDSSKDFVVSGDIFVLQSPCEFSWRDRWIRRRGEDRGVPFPRLLNPYGISVLGFIDSTIVLVGIAVNDMGEAEPCMAQVLDQKTSPSQRMLRILIGFGGVIRVRALFGSRTSTLYILLSLKRWIYSRPTSSQTSNLVARYNSCFGETRRVYIATHVIGRWRGVFARVFWLVTDQLKLERAYSFPSFWYVRWGVRHTGIFALCNRDIFLLTTSFHCPGLV